MFDHHIYCVDKTLLKLEGFSSAVSTLSSRQFCVSTPVPLSAAVRINLRFYKGIFSSHFLQVQVKSNGCKNYHHSFIC